VAQITSEGLLGSQFLSISPGNSDKMLKAGERVTRTQAPVDLMQLLGKYIFSPSDTSSQSSSGSKTP
jgi:phospholipid/cholesterol/gamma-HCH transport system substrate-binding protein